MPNAFELAVPLSQLNYTGTDTNTSHEPKNFDVEYVAELARIQLTPDEIKTFEFSVGAGARARRKTE